MCIAGLRTAVGACGRQVGYLFVTDQQRLDDLMAHVGWDGEEARAAAAAAVAAAAAAAGGTGTEVRKDSSG